MCKNKAIWGSIGLIVVALMLGSCAKPSPPPTEVVATEVPTEAAPTPTAPVVEAGACPRSTVADPMGISEGKWPQLYELAEYEGLAGCKMTFSSRSEFHPDLWTYGHIKGDLPPVEERLPEEPLVVQPYDEIGSYGGRERSLSIEPEGGNYEFLTKRHQNLLRYLDDLKTIVPNIAKAYEWNDDFTELTYTLRKGHKWSDGEPFTVDDILFWYEDIELNRELNPATNYLWIIGGEPLRMEKIDDQTVKIHFAANGMGFNIFVARGYICPFAPKHFLSQFHIKYNPDANNLAEEEGYASWVEYFYSWFGNWQDATHSYGIPKLESHILVEEDSEHKLFAANPYFFKVDTTGQQLPYIDELYQSYAIDYGLHELKVINGEVDQKSQTLELGSLALFKENQERGDYRIMMALNSQNGRMYAFNCTHSDPVLREIFSNPKFSQAMSLALNRQEMNDTLCYGLCQPEQGLPMHPTASFAKPEWFTYMIEYDPDSASALLDEIGLAERDSEGWRLRPDGKRLTILVTYPMQAGDPAMHEMAKSYWEAVGVKVELKEMTSEAYRAMAAANEHDVATFTSGEEQEVAQFSNPYRLVPPFGDRALEPLCGVAWYDWWKSGGESGEEPPDDVKRLFDSVGQWTATVPGSEEYMQLGQEIIEIHRDNFWEIGTIKAAPVIAIVKNNLKNVLDVTDRIQDFTFYGNYPYRPDQWFFGE